MIHCKNIRFADLLDYICVIGIKFVAGAIKTNHNFAMEEVGILAGRVGVGGDDGWNGCIARAHRKAVGTGGGGGILLRGPWKFGLRVVHVDGTPLYRHQQAPSSKRQTRPCLPGDKADAYPRCCCILTSLLRPSTQHASGIRHGEAR